MAPNPLREPRLFDVFTLDREPSPGVSTVAGCGSPRNWDEQKGKGTSGATLTYAGDGLPEFDAVIRLSTVEEIDDYNNRFARLLVRTLPGEKPKHKAFYSPWVSEVPHNITSIVILDVSQLEPDGDDGAHKVTIKLKEHREPAPAYGKPTGTPAGGGDPASTAADKEMAGLAGRVKELLG